MADLSNYVLGQEVTGFRQRVPENVVFNGKKHQVGVSLDKDEDVIEFETVPESGDADENAGLFDFSNVQPQEKQLRTVHVHPWLDTLYMHFGSGVNWTVFVTSGKRDGNSGDVDAPADDVELASGSGNEILQPQLALLPQQCIRVTSDAAGADGAEVLLVATETTSQYGRKG